MTKFNVTVSFTETGSIEIDAEDENEAIEKAQAALDNGDIETEGDGSYEFDVEEIDE